MKIHTKQTLRFYNKHIWNHKWLLLAMTISILGAVGTEMALPLYVKDIFDLFVSGADQDRSIAAAQMMSIVWIVLGLHILMNCFWRFNEFAANHFNSVIMKEIGLECFHYLTLHSFRFFSNHFAGSLVRKVNRMTWSFDNFFDRIYWDLLTLTIRTTTICVVITYFAPLLGAIVIAWVIVFVVANLFFARWKYPTDVAASAQDSKTSANLADVITNSITLKLFTSHRYERKQYSKNIEEWRRRWKWAFDLSSYINAGQAVLMIVLEIAMIILMIRFWEQGLVTVGILFLVQVYLFGLFQHLWNFKRVIQDIFRAFADAEDMTVILNTPHEIVDAPNAKPLKLHAGCIGFKKVTFGYDVDQPILKNFSLNITGGEKIALVGHSGEGKTTIAKLMMRFFDIQKGQILYDEQDISQVTVESLRSKISLVPQDPILFHRSLYENIRYGRRNATQEEVMEASKLANCHEFISKLKDSYKTLVGERGIKLSGGEKQRVAIARAILESAPLVILDEATSSLDSHSEKLIQQALHRLLKHKTAIIIAHRLSTIMEADRILVIQKGKVAEQGTHKELLRKPKGLYRQLWNIQAGGFIGG